MGCTCSRRSDDEVPGFSPSPWSCCFNRICFCGECSVIHPLSAKRDVSPSAQCSSITQSTGLREIASAVLVYPEIVQAHRNHNDQQQVLSDANVDGAHHPENLSGVCASDAEVLKEPNKDKETVYPLPVACKKAKDIGKVEADTIHQEEVPKERDKETETEKEKEVEEEDSCPICLEEYDAENPRIDTVCVHHFHLSCILEWMERSDCCPICDKDIVFNESP